MDGLIFVRIVIRIWIVIAKVIYSRLLNCA